MCVFVCLSVCQPIMQKAKPTRRACVLEGRRQEKFFHVLRHCDGIFFFLVQVISGRDNLCVSFQQRFPAFSHVFLFVSISFSPYININCVPCLGISDSSVTRTLASERMSSTSLKSSLNGQHVRTTQCTIHWWLLLS